MTYLKDIDIYRCSDKYERHKLCLLFFVFVQIKKIVIQGLNKKKENRIFNQDVIVIKVDEIQSLEHTLVQQCLNFFV